MGGELNWQALPIVCELYGITDIDIFISELVVVREYVNKGVK